jgi:hypothetical protein
MGYNWVIARVADSVFVTRVSRKTGEQLTLLESSHEDSDLVFSILKKSHVGDLIIFSDGKAALVGRSGAKT